MARLGTGYARYFNARHERAGHLFQNRFRSRRARDDADLIGLVLYVCRNPLEAGLAGDPTALEAHPWCSAGALSGRRAPYPFEAVGEALALFDADPTRARGRLREWLGLPARTDPAGCVLEPRPPELVPARDPDPTAIERVITEVCAQHCVSRDELFASRRRCDRIASARAAVAARAARDLRLSGSAIARALRVSPSAVTRMLARAGTRPPERVN
jgi:hypothetical protein